MYKEICDYLSHGIYPFHMPGHKGNGEFFPPEMHRLDLTEIPGMDVLSAPTGIIKNFCEKIAGFYGARESFFLTNGASAGIIAAICAASAEYNNKLYIARNAHVSTYNALVLSGARPVYFFSPENAIKKSEIPTFLLVSPTYEGYVPNIAAIAEKIHACGGILIVDEAHGAHFAFHDYFPASALAQGADIVINSLHKTLPAISGSAVLHISARVSASLAARLRFFINAAQTTSPSYMQMAACDFALEKLRQNPALFEAYVTRLKNLRQELGFPENKNQDPGKLLFARDRAVPKTVASIADEYKIQFEMETPTHLLAMTSVADTDEGFTRLKAAARGLGLLPAAATGPLGNSPTLPEIVLTPREAMLAEHETVPSEAAIGRVSAELIAQYPPGIAQIAPGERICEKLDKPYVQVIKALI